MNILLVSATHLEIEPLLKSIPIELSLSQRHSSFYYKGMEIDLMITGPGMVQAAFQMGLALQKKYDFAIQVGICGSFVPYFHIGEVVCLVEDQMPELGVEDQDRFINIFELGLIKKDNFPWTNGKLIPEESEIHLKIKAIKKAKGITVNTAHGRVESIRKITSSLNPEVETMEGAAFFYACISQNIPCLQIRAVSNMVEPRNTSAWNIELATKNLCKSLLKILDEIQ